MLKRKKRAAKEEIVPNFTGYLYSETIEDFAECDRISESELKDLACHAKYYLESNLNSFTDAELNDHLYRIYYPKRMDMQVLHRYLAYFVNLYPKQITQKVNTYLESKKLTLDEWLKSVKDGRRGDILCVFLLSMATASHTAVHLKHNKIWSTLNHKPSSHDELMRQCDKHLAYLGLGIFLELKERTPFNIIGTTTGEDPETHKHLLASVTQPIKLEEQSDYISRPPIKQCATAAVGSKSQLERVEKEMRTTTRIIGTTKIPAPSTRKKVAGSSDICIKNPMVNHLPFEVRIVRLSEKEILKYTCPLPSVNLRSVPGRFSPVKTRSMRFTSVPKHDRKHVIRGKPTQRLVSSLTIWKHVLRKRKPQLRLKCRTKNCSMAYVSFKTHKDLNAHHHIYHPNILFKCHSCKKRFSTPSTWKNHKYGCSRQKLYNCDSCNKRFLFSSTLQQHIRCHISQKLFKCFYGKCQRRYKYPQDLDRHIATHSLAKFGCEMCDKTFSQKRLLKRHSVVHLNVCAYKCSNCNEAFKHYNQLYRHRKRCP